MIMKKILFFLALILISSRTFAFDADFYDIDDNLIDSLDKLESIKTQGGSFTPQFVSDEQFNQAIEQMKPKPKKPWKLTKWLFGIKDEQLHQSQDIPTTSGPSEFDLMRDALSSNNLVSLYAPIVDDYGHIVPIGHYRVVQKNVAGVNYILLKQINKTFGCFKAYEEDDKEYNKAVVYSRIQHDTNSDFLKIIFSDFDKTYKAKAKIIK